MAKKLFLKGSELSELHELIVIFAKYLQKHNEELDYDLGDEKVRLGLNLGIRSSLTLLNSFLVDEKGLLEKEGIKKMLKNIEKES